MTKIRIENITQQFALPGKRLLTALENINLEIEAGEFIAIIGESGCGKSTLLNLIAGLQKPHSGSVTVNGKNVDGPHHSRMMMFQQPCLLPWLTVEQNIAFGCKLRKDTSDYKSEVARFIRLIGLEGFEKVFPNALSAGMLQRVALARSLISRPEILLMDESFSDVDFFTRVRLLQLLQQLWKEFKLTVLLVTHDVSEALILAQRIILVGDRPGVIKHEFPIDLPYPRDPRDTLIHQKKNHILDVFKRLTPTFEINGNGAN